MRYFDLRPFTRTDGVRGGNEALAAADACVRVFMSSCPAVRLIKVYVCCDFAEEAMKKWELLEVSPNLVWYTFQAFPMRNTQCASLVAMNSRRMVELWNVWDIGAFAVDENYPRNFYHFKRL